MLVYIICEQRNARPGEFGMQLVRSHHGSISVMSLDQFLVHAAKGISPNHSKSDWFQIELVIDAQVRNGDTDDVGLRRHDVLRVNSPDAIVGEIKGAFNLTLADPLKATHEVGIVFTSRRNSEHSNQTSCSAWQDIDDHIERSAARRRRRRIVAVVK